MSNTLFIARNRSTKAVAQAALVVHNGVAGRTVEKLASTAYENAKAAQCHTSPDSLAAYLIAAAAATIPERIISVVATNLSGAVRCAWQFEEAGDTDDHVYTLDEDGVLSWVTYTRSVRVAYVRGL